MLAVLPFLLLCYGIGNAHCLTVHENKEDFYSLLEFKQGISNPEGALSNWNPNTHFCHWNGVNCTLTGPWRVTGLNLSQKGLSGQISASLGNLTFLTTLDLSHNNFVGRIPPLNKLQDLQYLSLMNNFLQGSIPIELTNCSNLTYLDLTQNNLTGVIPPSIGFLSKLIYLSLYENNLNGVIPPALGNITTLNIVSLAYNQLNGTIPHEIWQTSSIKLLYLNNNNLSGGIPRTLPNISSLIELSLADNMLGNTLPSNIGDALPNLQILYLDGNNFKGHIPASLGNPLGLEQIDLSLNNFSGKIPSSLGNLSNLEFLNLEYNLLEARDSEGWEFFDALGKCKSLSVLSLLDNQLQGAIPNSIAKLSTNLTILSMSLNSLSGIVPQGIGKLSGLQKLALAGNNLNGTIEEWIGDLTNLTYLNLSSNNFNGAIPPSTGHLTQLTYFDLSKNNFNGFVPPGLGKLLPMLILDLSHNNFQGSIPAEFGNFRQLNILDLSSNKFSGEIPETLGQFQQIFTIRLDQNILTGNVPFTFSHLKSLTTLNLSHNNLSGPMPACLTDLNLTKLDLSYNNFQGEIPRNGVYNNPTVVSLDGNPGLCGGAMGWNMPSCHVVSRRVSRANYLIKILIPIFGFMSLVLLVYFLLLEKKTSRRAYLAQTFGEHFEKVTYNDLAQATQDFSESNMIGRGSYGSVYRGKLKESKVEVAVKVFDLEMRGAERSFLSECEALRSIQHRNLLPIITACSTVDNAGNVFKALVYELIPNGNLDAWLHDKGDKKAPKRLDLIQRISIATNIADVLDYLHHDCGRPTVHCDLKPSNILLDDDMNAILADFGIARFYADPQAAWAGSISSIGVKGTIGYIPPEYGGGGHASTSGDVYSFGIVLLEILTSKRPTDSMFTNGLDIISFVENSFPDQIFQVIDAYLVEECKNLTQEKKVQENDIYQCLVVLLQVALSCTRSLPSERSNMKQVASKMHAIKSSHLGRKNK